MSDFLHGGHVKEALSIFLPTKHYLSPAQGACLANGLMLQNLYNFAHEGTAGMVGSIIHLTDLAVCEGTIPPKCVGRTSDGNTQQIQACFLFDS